MPDPIEYLQGAAERRAQEEAELKESKEAKRRERREEIGIALRGALIIWDIVRVLVH
jgi:predicted NUDIX family NTP pyrophosphohydrolase